MVDFTLGLRIFYVLFVIMAMVSNFPYSLTEIQEIDGTSKESFKLRSQNTSTYGMKFYPETYNFCISKLELISKDSPNHFDDTGDWMFFINKSDCEQIHELLQPLLGDNDGKILSIHFDQTSSNKYLVHIKCRPFYNFSVLHKVFNKIGEQLQGYNNTVYNRFSLFFKPSILNNHSIHRSNKLNSYILKKPVIVA